MNDELVGLPCNLQAERTILGAVLLDNEAWVEVRSKLLPQDFSLDSHQRIALRMAQLNKACRPIDLVTLCNELNLNHEIEPVGGVAYISSLTEGLPRRPVVDEYVRIVKDKSVLRQLMISSSAAIARAAEQSETGMEIISDLSSQLGQIADAGRPDEEDAHVSASIVASLDRFHKRRRLQKSPGIPFGIPDLDELTGGMMEGFQTAVGAMSGVGKTTFMAQAILETLRAGHRVQAFLREPTKGQLNMRLVSLIAGVPYRCVTKEWTCNEEQTASIDWAAQELAEMPLYSYDRSSQTLDDAIAIASIGIRKHDTRLVTVDYIQRMRISNVERDEPLRMKVGRASTAFADLVKGTRCHSLVLSQIGTGRKSGANAIPTMFDFRESAQIEQDAHTIVLLHREYDPERGHFGKKGAIFVPKQREGDPGNIQAWFDPVTAAWTDQDPGGMTR